MAFLISIFTPVNFGWVKPSSTFTGSETAANLNSANAKSVTVKAQWEASGSAGSHNSEWNGAVIDTMQAMTASICNSVTTPNTAAPTVPEIYLKDARDSKIYIIRKLADGKCWMAQNLELMLSTSKTLTSSDTDLHSKSSYTPSYSTETMQNHFQESGACQYTYYYGPGLRDCSSYVDDSLLYMKDGLIASSSGSQYERRGIYYSWGAATALSYYPTFKSEEYWNIVNAPDSICPYGWKLPLRVGAGSFSNLISIYGIIVDSESVDFNSAGGKYPLNYVLAGSVQASGGISGVGTNAFYQTSATSNITSSGDGGLSLAKITNKETGIVSYKSSIVSNGGSNQSVGYSIRCVAR